MFVLWQWSLLFAIVSFASGGSRVGLAAFPWLSLTDYARPAGLAQAYTGLASGLDGVSLNPAGLAKEKEQRVWAVNYEQWFLESNKGSIAYASNFQRYFYAFSVAYQSDGENEVTEIDEAGEMVTTDKSIKPYSMNPSLAIAKEINSYVAVGGAFKLPMEYLGNFYGSQWALGWGMDLGLQYQPKTKRYSFGMAALNLGRLQRSPVENGKRGYGLPFEYKVGMVYHGLAKNKGKLVADVGFPYYASPYIAVGVERSLTRNFQIRAGTSLNVSEIKYRFQELVLSKEDEEFDDFNIKKINAGFSYSQKSISIEYAGQYWLFLGMRHVLSVKLRY